MKSRGAVVAITGGARGIGLATARALEERGASVHIGDLDGRLAHAEARRVGLASGHALDVTDRSSFAAFLDQVRSADGPLDILVNNAGVMPFVPFLEEDDDITAQTIAVNLTGVVNGMRLALPAMLERGSGHVINVASLAGRVPVPGSAVYSATKAAVVALTDAVRRELRGTGVCLSSVLPTIVATELTDGVPRGRGLHSIAPEDVAAAIARALERSGGTVVAAPPGIDLLSRIMVVVPRVVNDLVRAVIRDDRLLVDRDVAARAGYDARLAAARRGTAAAGRMHDLRPIALAPDPPASRTRRRES